MANGQFLTGIIVGVAAVVAVRTVKNAVASGDAGPFTKATARSVVMLGEKFQETAAELGEVFEDTMAELQAQASAQPAPADESAASPKPPE